MKLVEAEQADIVPADTFNRDVNVKTKIGDRFARLAELPTFPLDRLSRYEHMLWRQARQLLFSFELLHHRRQVPKRLRYLLLYNAKPKM